MNDAPLFLLLQDVVKYSFVAVICAAATITVAVIIIGFCKIAWNILCDILNS